MYSFCIVQTGLVSGNYDSAGGIREISAPDDGCCDPQNM